MSISKEALQRFAEQNPERFKALQDEAARTYNKPTFRRPQLQTTIFRKSVYDMTLAEFSSIYNLKERHYLMHTIGIDGKSHRLFHSGETPEEAITEGKRMWPDYSTSVIRTERCYCNACKRRDEMATS